MKIQSVVVTFFLLCFAMGAFAQAKSSQQLVFPFLTLESQSNINVVASYEHPLPCPLEYTNLAFNTNLFSVSEQELLAGIPLKYTTVSTNSGPAGTAFK